MVKHRLMMSDTPTMKHRLFWKFIAALLVGSAASPLRKSVD